MTERMRNEGEELLAVEGLTKAFGALKAVCDVTLDVRCGEIHAVIGPNGAGKSTLVNLVTGFLVPDAGRILFGGRDITRLEAPARARAGLARTFQISNLVTGQTALANVMLAVEARLGRERALGLGFWRPFATDPTLRKPAELHLARVGLAGRGGVAVAQLSHGERRQLEVAVALATEARLLLLDEPMAGLGPEDAGDMIRLLEDLKARHGILLIEHDMDAVFQLADRISVLVYGEVLFTGTPAEVRASRAVRDAYLGDEGA